MKLRRIGGQGLAVADIGLGCMGLGAGYSAGVSEEQANQVLRRAVELGVSFFDTAEIYGASEIVVGKALKSFRDQVVIATKFGFQPSREKGGPLGLNSRPEHIREVCDASLRRLGVDVLDLFFQHRVDPQVPIEDVAGTIDDLVRAGKIKYFGLSEASANTIRRAHAVHPVTAVQTEYSLWSRQAEDEILPVCRELDIGFIAYSPLGRGFLAGGAQDLPDNDRRKALPRWQGDAFVKNLSLFDTLKALAAQKSCTPAQLALAWVLHKGGDIVPIPGTTKAERLEQNVAASGIVLTVEDLAAIEATAPQNAVAGERHDATEAAWADRQ